MRGSCRDGPDRVGADDARAGQLQLLEVLLDRPARGAVALDEGRARSAARQRFQAHRARAGEEVEDGRAVDRPDQVEGGLAHAVAGRPRREPFRRGDPRAPLAAGDDPHGVIV